MTTDILICTIDQGIGRISDVLMPPIPQVHYVVSVQYTTAAPPKVEAAWTARQDVTLTFLAGRGLSRNRNNALAHATGDIVIFADDDCRYKPEYIENVQRAYDQHPEADAICFMTESYDGHPLKAYPDTALPYSQARLQGYYPVSVEITFRRRALQSDGGLRFNESFGLGAPLPAGEEDVLLADALRAGCAIWFVPMTLTRTDPVTTGDRFLQDTRLQQTKGAVFRHCFGLSSALWRTLKEGGYHLVYHHVNPFPIWYNMLQGIWK